MGNDNARKLHTPKPNRQLGELLEGVRPFSVGCCSCVREPCAGIINKIFCSICCPKIGTIAGKSAKQYLCMDTVIHAFFKAGIVTQQPAEDPTLEKEMRDIQKGTFVEMYCSTPRGAITAYDPLNK